MNHLQLHTTITGLAAIHDAIVAAQEQEKADLRKQVEALRAQNNELLAKLAKATEVTP